MEEIYKKILESISKNNKKETNNYSNSSQKTRTIINDIRIINYTFKNNLYYKGNLVLKYKINFPQIIGCEKFNIYNYNLAKKLQEKCEGELLEEAKELYDYNSKNNYPIMVYEVLTVYNVTYNYNMVISLYSDEYIFSGGAHGNTKRTSQSWNLNKEKMLKLEDFYSENPNYVSTIISEVNAQIASNIKNGNNYYFDNYCCLTSENFKIENYYLNRNNIIIYYQQYDIAPYSSGILTFNVGQIS